MPIAGLADVRLGRLRFVLRSVKNHSLYLQNPILHSILTPIYRPEQLAKANSEVVPKGSACINQTRPFDVLFYLLPISTVRK